jgi:predicted nucleotidyltransferase
MTADPNLGVIELAASALGILTQELVLVGGCAVGLLITDPARTPVRQTVDVDLVAEVTTLASYHELGEKLRKRGFSERPTDSVICRWAKGTLVIDVMPTDEKVLGFTNAWYTPAVLHAQVHSLPSGQKIRLITSPYFLATKLESFASRANGDYTHHDMEDIVTVIDGRVGIMDEVLRSHQNVRNFLMDEIEALLADSSFIDRLPWLLNPNDLDARRTEVLSRMRRIAGI